MPSTHSHKRHQRALGLVQAQGFSLLETLVALLLVSWMALLVAQMQPTLMSWSQQQQAQQVLQAWQMTPLAPAELIPHLSDLAACTCSASTAPLALWCDLCSQLPPLELVLHQYDQAYQLEVRWREPPYLSQRIWLGF
ncbi:prepilin-type N-terminal cleavage/methylation domain-containing protein [Marinospirillum sp.]|uniref:prepilin-type N-terminal cleavage/methylation domain-containing protein n=1 Tax=Marinospirillum sp. TaxID=2183934 RepID=UPI003A8766B0